MKRDRREYAREYYRLNRDKILARHAEYFRNNRSKVYHMQCLWRLSHKENVAAIQHRGYLRKKAINDSFNHLDERAKSELLEAFRQKIMSELE